MLLSSLVPPGALFAFLFLLLPVTSCSGELLCLRRSSLTSNFCELEARSPNLVEVQKLVLIFITGQKGFLEQSKVQGLIKI